MMRMTTCRFTGIVVMLLLLMISMVSSSLAQDEAGALFTTVGDGPVVEFGPRGEWDGRYTDPGAVTYHDGQFYMFRNGFQSWPASVQVGYLTSDDGINWTEVTEEPVFTTDEVDYAGTAMLASSAEVRDDGTWALYFYTWERPAFRGAGGAIGLATADDPLGPWTPLPEAILSPGSRGEWDETQLAAPSVVRTDTGYVMYYTGYDSRNRQSIGMATSEDGITWTKYDDPTTTEAPFAESDPVLIPAEEWEAEAVHQPRVVKTDDGWVMIYRSPGPGRGMMRLGLATSEDGINWTKSADNPIFAPDDLPNGNTMWFTALTHVDDTFYLYVEGSDTAGVPDTSIYVATYTGDLVGD